MGRYVFNLPDIGEGIAEAEIVTWHVAVGDWIDEDGRLADVMTDKATVEMESPVAGMIVEVAGEAGDLVPIGSPLVVIETEANESIGSVSAKAQDVVPSEPRLLGEPRGNEVPASGAPPVPSSEREPTAAIAARAAAAPAVRARAAALGIDLLQVRPAVAGRIRHSDLDAYIANNPGLGFQPAGARRTDEVVKVVGLRRRIAENMAAAKRHIPHFSYVERYDVTELERVRAQLNSVRGERPKLTVLPLLIAAICKLMPKYPMLNAHYDDERGEVTRFGAVHLGMAVQTPGGLMVAVIRDAQDRNLWQLAVEIERLAAAVRSGAAKSAELTGSTITLTSLGPMGGVVTTPVINRPEVAIIGPNAIFEQLVSVRDALGAERIEKRKLMNISMSCDHRVVDGWDAASFAQELKSLIEAPALILSEGF